MARGDDLIARIQKGLADKLDDLIRAASEDDIAPFKSELLRNGFAQIISAAVRVNVRALDGFTHCRHGFRRWPERVFIRGELDDLMRLEAKFTRDVLNRFARFVRYEIAQPGVSSIPKGHRERAGIWRGPRGLPAEIPAQRPSGLFRPFVPRVRRASRVPLWNYPRDFQRSELFRAKAARNAKVLHGCPPPNNSACQASPP